MHLVERKCTPCEGGVSKLNPKEINSLNLQLKQPWLIVDDMKICRDFHFKGYLQTIIFVNKVAEIAESEGHHPVMHVFFNKVRIEIWTHAILGLSENDFILAAKIDDMFSHE